MAYKYCQFHKKSNVSAKLCKLVSVDIIALLSPKLAIITWLSLKRSINLKPESILKIIGLDLKCLKLSKILFYLANFNLKIYRKYTLS